MIGGSAVVVVYAGDDVDVGFSDGCVNIVRARDLYHFERESRMLGKVFQHALRDSFELAGLLVE